MGMKVNGTTGLTFPDTTTLASAGQASVRAWVNFNGTGTVAIRASYNVASITDNGTGDYTVNFTTAMPDANYSAVTDGQIVSGVADITTQIAAAGFSTGSFRMNSQNNSTNALTDSPLITASVFR